MSRKRFTAEQIIHKLRQAEVELANGQRMAQVCKTLGISEQTYYRWRREYGGLRLDQAKRLKTLEQENARLKTLVAEQALGASVSGRLSVKTDALGRYPIPPDRWKDLNRSVLNRMGAAEDIAGTIIFLASDLGNFITGEDIYVDGGETLHMGHDARDMINPDMFEKRERGDGKNE